MCERSRGPYRPGFVDISDGWDAQSIEEDDARAEAAHRRTVERARVGEQAQNPVMSSDIKFLAEKVEYLQQRVRELEKAVAILDPEGLHNFPR